MYIRDEDIKTAFLRMIRKLQTAHDQVLKPFVMGAERKKGGTGNSSNKPDEFWLY